jgi:DNA-binding CsgD family transcriptional regulator
VDDVPGNRRHPERLALLLDVRDRIGLSQLAELEVEGVRTRPVPLALVDRLGDALVVKRPRAVLRIRLSLRERWILLMIAAGQSDRQIGAELTLPQSLVADARRRLRWRYDAANSAELVARAFRAGDLA